MQANKMSLANILQTEGGLWHYHVPKYQREYTWGKNEWEQLLSDIDENEPGYFMGSIICIADQDFHPGAYPVVEIVDGQQRLTTISLLLMAIFKAFRGVEKELGSDLELEEQLPFLQITKQLVIKELNKPAGPGYFWDSEKYCFLRVQPSTQKHNYADYLHILKELDLIKGDFHSKFCKVRRLYKAYDYLYSHIPKSLKDLKQLLNKIHSLNFVYISVSSSSDAFTLFESLNNRGVPLSIMDIIKNKMLASLEKTFGIIIENAYENWQDLLSYLPEYQDQERFLRHYYNAFKVDPAKKIDNYAKATKSNLIKIYEHYINNDAKGIFDELLEKSKLYNRFIQPENHDNGKQIEHKHLTELKRVGSSPSYLLLLYLYSLEEGHYEDRQATLKDVLYFLWLYYVRRNITDFPNTKDLDAINMELIETCQDAVDRNIKITSGLITDKIYNGKGKPASFEKFRESLTDNLFYHNSAMARYVLVKLEEEAQSKEYKTDLWARSDKGILVWTVEHIFPQGSNIPDCWVSMLAAGDKKLASEIQAEWVHCLGNLTLSGYNSKLSNACFKDKQNLSLEKKFLGHRIKIGYQNGLYLNQIKFNVDNQKAATLATINEWTQKSIEARNDVIVRMLLKMFAFDNEKHKIAESNI